ncbi:protein dispatched homolog 3-like [Saccostrea echinata]|uniref:protein dispatched homolog 3-like n=1 Tax=Saccostrea echinata TaxID=191078 RepID=UPI002A7F2112|nr:protein dispatched homolog 3-like [Saccostrea echinata]
MISDSVVRGSSPVKVTPSQDSNKEGIQDETEELERARREKKPFFYCRLVAKYPVKCFVITLSCHIAMVIISGILLATGFNLFPTNFEKLPMELYDIPYRVRDYAWQDKDSYSNKIKRTLSQQVVQERGLFSVFSSIDLFYDTDGGNIFTKANLQRIHNIENDLASSTSYSSVCMTHNDTLACKPFKSVLRYFDGTYKQVSATLDDPNFNNIAAVLYEAFTNNATKEDFQFFLPKGYSLTATHAHGTITRSILRVGCSINGSTKCLADTWKKQALTYLKDGIQTKLKKYVDESTDDFKFYFFCTNLWLSDTLKQAILDMLCAVGSMLFIFCFMLFHTRSFWIAGFAILSILLSFLGTNIIYTGVIDFQYFGFFHILSIFIILGIGADDLFVFYDNWRLTAFSTYPSLAHRLSDAYSKSVLSMFITSLTTAVAFFSSSIFSLLATRSFGIFSGVLVIYNYMSVIIFFPTVITVYHLKFEQWNCPCCRKCKEKEDETTSEKTKTGVTNEVFVIKELELTVEDTKLPKGGTNGSVVNVTVNGNPVSNIKEKSTLSSSYANGIANGKSANLNGHANGFIANGKPSANGTIITSENKNTQDSLVVKALHKKKQKKLTVFFRDYYLRFITNKITRCIAIPVYAVVVAFLAYSASTLQPDNEELQIYKKSHFYTKAQNKELYSFVKNVDDNLVKIYIVWGISEKDRSDCHFSSVDCRGNQVYDSSFNPNPLDNQLALMSFCNSFYSMSPSELSMYKIKTDISGNPEVACFTRDLDTYLKSLSIGGLNLSLPWDSARMLSFMNAQPTYYDPTGFSSYTDWLSIPMQYWMYAGYSGNYTADYGVYNDLFGEEKTTFSKQLKTDNSIYYGNKLKYLAVQVNTTINKRITGYSTGIPLIEKWEKLIENKMKTMPTGVNSAVQLTKQTWHWIYVLKKLADNALLGIVIGVCLAFPILSLSTMNFVIGFLATFSICCTTVCVIGVIPLAGWKLGLLTSLNMCLVVGLAVDFVVHLAEGYTLSLHKDRYNRTLDMLEEMGSSVFSGACTTLGAALFMFAAEIQFFMQFGVFMFCTIGFSLIFSLGLFTLLVGLLGPQNNTGNLKVLFQKCRSRCQRTDSKR